MKKLMTVAILAAIGSAYGEKALNYPVYAVTVPQGVSNSFAALSADCTFTRTATEGATPEVTSYADFLAESAAGTLVKEGPGWLVIEEPIADWTGQIHVEEGVLRAACSNALGKVMVSATSTVSYPSDADGTFVSSGATLFMDASFCSSGPTREKKTIVFEGTGALGMNGALVAYGRGLKDNTAWPLGANPRLSGDATLYIDINHASSSLLATCHRLSLNKKAMPPTALDLAGHTLTLKGRVDEGYDAYHQSDINFNSGIISNGHIVVENVIFHQQNTPVFVGDATSSLHMTAPSVLSWESLNAPLAQRWTLIFESSQLLRSSQSNLASMGYELGQTNYFCWNGPVELRTTLRMEPGTSGRYGAVFNGPVSGPYGMHVNFMNTNYLALHLSSSANTFTGGVGLNKSRLFAYCNGAVPATGGMLAATNSEAYFPATEEYLLPSAEFVGTGLVFSAYGVSATGTWNTVFTKKGNGELFYNSNFGAPLLDVQGGGVKLRNDAAGLVYGILPGSNTSRGAVVEMESSVVPTNTTALGTDMFYQTRPKFTCYVYSGYIWNREATNVNWTFVSGLHHGSRFIFDGEVKFSQNIADNTRPPNVAQLEIVAPGPHRFEMRNHSGLSSASGGYGINTMANHGWTWGDKKYFMWDPLGRASSNIVDYVQAYDPGDGSIFSVTTNGVLPETQSLRPQFPAMRFAPGTYFDVNGVSFATGDLTGAPTITNSSALFTEYTFSVTNSWTVPAADFAAGAVLDVSGTLAFGADVALAITDFAELPHTESRVLARAAAGIEGMPTFTPPVAHPSRWRYRKSPDGRELLLDYCAGTALLLR